MFVGAAFLIARASAAGIADATFANGAMLIANNAATAREDIRFVMGSAPLDIAKQPYYQLQWR
jgi:hypothetical protein